MNHDDESIAYEEIDDYLQDECAEALGALTQAQEAYARANGDLARWRLDRQIPVVEVGGSNLVVKGICARSLAIAGRAEFAAQQDASERARADDKHRRAAAVMRWLAAQGHVSGSCALRPAVPPQDKEQSQ